MDTVGDPRVSEIVIVSAAQMLKTELLLNVIGFYSTYDPGPMMMVQPTIEMGEAISKDRIAPSIRDTPEMREAFGDPYSRDSGNTILHKQFPGGHLTIAGANSPASLASRPIRILLCDEVDRYPDSAGTEGDPVGLAKKRTTTFWNRKILLTSTPTLKGSSRIVSAFEETDQRFYHIPCPRCGVPHRLQWSNVVWGSDTPAKGDHHRAVFQCPSCAGHYTDTEKDAAVKRGKWIATAPFTGKAGFQISELYSPWKRLAETVSEFLSAKGNPERMKVWTNTALGEAFEEDGESVSEHDIEARAENYPSKKIGGKETQLVPARVTIITVGADTQPDRIEAEAVGWAGGEESWSLDYAVFYGDPDIPEGQKGSPWDAFTDWLREQRPHETGITMPVSFACIDTGGSNTQAVYQYVRRHRGDRIFGIKGFTGPDRPIIGGPSRKRSGKNGRPIDLYPVGHDACKHTVMGRFKIAEPGPGYCHFPKGREPEYYRQLTSEKLVTKYVKGRAKREWIKIEGRRNEALDVRCYATAALMLGQPKFDRLAFRLKKQVERAGLSAVKESQEEEQDDSETEIEDATPGVDNRPPVQQPPKRPVSRKRHRGGYSIRTW